MPATMGENSRAVKASISFQRIRAHHTQMYCPGEPSRTRGVIVRQATEPRARAVSDTSSGPSPVVVGLYDRPGSCLKPSSSPFPRHEPVGAAGVSVFFLFSWLWGSLFVPRSQTHLAAVCIQFLSFLSTQIHTNKET